MDERRAGVGPRDRNGRADLPGLPLLAPDDEVGSRPGRLAVQHGGADERGQHLAGEERAGLRRPLVRPVPVLRHARRAAGRRVEVPQTGLPLRPRRPEGVGARQIRTGERSSVFAHKSTYLNHINHKSNSKSKHQFDLKYIFFKSPTNEQLFDLIQKIK